ncbi:glycoside hydrolase family 97 N-terminal domain-containing protein [Streptomyces sp. M19]
MPTGPHRTRRFPTTPFATGARSITRPRPSPSSPPCSAPSSAPGAHPRPTPPPRTAPGRSTSRPRAGFRPRRRRPVGRRQRSPVADGPQGPTTVLEPAPLGVVTTAADFTSGLRQLGRTQRPVTEHYTTTTGKRRERTARMTETRLAFADAAGHRMDLVVRVAADGVGYRYVLPARDGDAVTVRRESSAFRLPTKAPPGSCRTRPTTSARTPRRPHRPPRRLLRLPSLFRVRDDYVLLSESDVDGATRAATWSTKPEPAASTSSSPTANRSPQGPVGDAVAHRDDRRPGHRRGVDAHRRPRAAVPGPRHLLDPARPGGLVLARRIRRRPARPGDPEAVRRLQRGARLGVHLVDDGWKTTDWMPELIRYADRRGCGSCCGRTGPTWTPRRSARPTSERPSAGAPPE